MFRHFAHFAYRFRWGILAVLLSATALTAVSIFFLRIDPSMEMLFAKNSPEYEYYKSYRRQFGNDQMISVAMDTQNLFTLKNLWLVKTLTDEISKFKTVDRVLSLSNAVDFEHKRFGVRLAPVLEKAFEGEQSMEQLRRAVLSNELLVQNLVSDDGKVANIVVFLKSYESDVNAGGFVIKKLRDYLEKYETPDIQFYVAGAPVEQYDFVRLIRKDQSVFIPVIAGLLVITSLLIYHSLACVFFSMAIVFMTLIWSMGAIALSGHPLNLMTSLLAPVIMIVSVVNSIHIMNRFFEIRVHQPNVEQAVVLTLADLGVPCFLANITTVIGFGSLAFNRIPAISSFGTFAALGTLFSYGVEMLLTPVLLPMLPYRRTGGSIELAWLNHALSGFLERIEFQWKWVIAGLTVLGILASCYGIRHLEVDNNLVRQMKQSLPLAVSTRFIDRHLTGVYTMGFVISRKDRKPFTDRAGLLKIEEFKRFLETLPSITKVQSLTTVIKRIQQAIENDAGEYQIPEDQARLDKIFEGLSQSSNPELWSLVSKDFKQLRLEVRIKAVGTREGGAVEDAAREYLIKHFSKEFEFTQTGNVVLLGRVAKQLVTQQVGSFGIASAAIFLLICLIFRSWVMGLFAFIPNLFPILAVYGLMGFLRIELSTTTAMISNIVMGMVVDEAIHFLHRFRHEFEHRRHYVQALHHTFRSVGPSLTIATLILSVGFASSIFAQFRPTIHFGILTSFTIFFSAVCTLLILPAALVALKPFGRQKLFPSHQPAKILQEAQKKIRIDLDSSGDLT